MRARVLALIACVLLVVPLAGQTDTTYESITVADTAIGLTATVTNPTDGKPQQNVCLARLETASIRYRVDGTDPTSSEGLLLDPGDIVTLSSNATARRARFIRTGSTSGTLKVSCRP